MLRPFIVLRILFLLYGFSVVAIELEQKPIVIVIPSYNNERYCKSNLESIFKQNYENYRVIYIDDCSTDRTYQFANHLITAHNQWHRVDLIRNEKRRGALANIYDAVHSCNDGEIIALVDGDDWLTHERVLARVNQEYVNPDVWLTYGQHADRQGGLGCCKPISKDVVAQNTYRDAPCIASALRTFNAWLFKCINKKDLLYQGDFFSVTWDWAMMYPMLEMSGGRFKFISDVLYIYNMNNPIADYRINNQLQWVLGGVIKKRKRYQPLKRKPV